MENKIVKWILIAIVLIVILNYFNLGREFFSAISPDKTGIGWSGGG